MIGGEHDGDVDTDQGERQDVLHHHDQYVLGTGTEHGHRIHACTGKEVAPQQTDRHR